MRTTVRLDEDLLTAVKAVALRSGMTLTAVIEDALRAYLATERYVAERPPVYVTTFEGKGVLPGVDLDDSAALLELMERDDDPV